MEHNVNVSYAKKRLAYNGTESDVVLTTANGIDHGVLISTPTVNNTKTESSVSVDLTFPRSQGRIPQAMDVSSRPSIPNQQLHVVAYVKKIDNRYEVWVFFHDNPEPVKLQFLNRDGTPTTGRLFDPRISSIGGSGNVTAITYTHGSLQDSITIASSLSYSSGTASVTSTSVTGTQTLYSAVGDDGRSYVNVSERLPDGNVKNPNMRNYTNDGDPIGKGRINTLSDKHPPSIGSGQYAYAGELMVAAVYDQWQRTGLYVLQTYRTIIVEDYDTGLVAVTPDTKYVFAYDSSSNNITIIDTSYKMTKYRLWGVEVNAVTACNGRFIIACPRVNDNDILKEVIVGNGDPVIKTIDRFLALGGITSIAYDGEYYRYGTDSIVVYDGPQPQLLQAEVASPKLGASISTSQTGFTGVKTVADDQIVVQMTTPSYNVVNLGVTTNQDETLTLKYSNQVNGDIMPSDSKIKITGTVSSYCEDYIECVYDIYNATVDPHEFRGSCYDGYIKIMAENWVRFYVVAPRLGPYLVGCGNSYTRKVNELQLEENEIAAYGQAKFLMGRLVTPLRTFSCKWLLRENYDELMRYVKASDVYHSMYDEYFKPNLPLEEYFV